ncbi:hypothetical protein GGI25_004070 [Coemansia spiralis]|uniref:Uncharacterized protein n=2 Tax=Coemansia TaxID=4863 RepID=A0A9W8KXS0_9FUNG|nr:hypothetical protein EDC05_003288 [Coemansia umbellata]KAJ2620843.1 hypothetical protein GGI26_004638 [Coemansia sp. RSA 1358]KAJ2675230.1 hypothetical protein GGI25_004070 [Coemansia spiralis]
MALWMLTTLAGAWIGYKVLLKLRPTPSVRGRKVVIVGASSGIGRSTALEYAQRGAHLLLCARRKDELAQVADLCRAATPLASTTVHVVVGDVTKRETQMALRDKAMGLWGGETDYLVLNAGALSVRPIAELWGISPASEPDHVAKVDQQVADRADELLRQMMDINLHAPATIAGLLLPMLARSKGSIVVVSSMVALVAAPTRSLYTASKQAVSGYFCAMRMEIQRQFNVAVTIVYPGTVATDLRLAALDREGPGPVAGSASSKMSAQKCAQQIVRAAALRERELITPLPYRISAMVHTVAPSVVEHMARKKYGLA